MSGTKIDADLLGREVLDVSCDRIGELSALYVDADTRAVLFAGVAMIRRGRRRTVFVPMDDALVETASVTLRCPKELIRRAPYVRPGESMPGDLEAGLYAHYEVGYVAPNAVGRRLARFC
jgi:hypothetical protein